MVSDGTILCRAVRNRGNFLLQGKKSIGKRKKLYIKKKKKASKIISVGEEVLSRLTW